MKVFKTRKRKTKKNIISIIIFLSLILSCFMFIIYGKLTNKRIISITKIKINDYLSNNINYNIINGYDTSNLLDITRNSDGEIIYANYNLKESYEILDTINNKIKRIIKDINDLSYIELPIFIYSNNVFLNNLGPRIYVPINFNERIVTNLKSKITNYGLNNALVEMYITVKLTLNLITPYSKDESIIEYNYLISSTIINGRVPSIYGKTLDNISLE